MTEWGGANLDEGVHPPPDVADAAVPAGVVNGRILAPIRDYAVARLGEPGGARFDAALRDAGYDPAVALDPHGWMPLPALHAVVEALRPLLGEDFLIDSTCWAVPRRLEFSAMSLDALASPAFVYRHLDRARSFFAQHLAFEVRMQSSESGEFVLHYVDGVPRCRDSCQIARGILHSIPLIFGLPAAEVIHEGVCYADGADACRYRVRWRAPRPWARVGLLAGSAVAVLGFLAVPSVAWLLAPAVGFLAGREIHERIRRRMMISVAEEQRRLLETNEREFQRRYADVREINSVLERRVEERTLALREAVADLAAQNQSLRESLQQMKEMQGDVVDAAMRTMMGQRVAEFAHEIRNPMTYVLSNLQFLESAPQTPEALAEFSGAAADVRAGVERMQAVLSWFLELNRHGGARTPARYDLGAEVRRTVAVFRQELDGRISVVLEADEVEPFDAFGHELTQVLVNLLTNASQALRRGTVTVRVWNARSAIAPQGAAPGSVGFSVVDDGPGIPAELQARLFERGFTTKPAGRGSGLGLYICRAIVERHGGRIFLESREGEGTRVHVEIPLGTARA